MSVRTIAVALILASSQPALAEEPQVAPFKALCVARLSTGFNWSDGQWKPAQFNPDAKILAQKIEVSRYSGRPPAQRPLRCTPEERIKKFGEFTAVRACYLITEVGGHSHMNTAEMCDENFRGTKLISIACRTLTFLPDGSFIRLPWHMDIDESPKNGYKDSLSLTVGECSRLED